MRTWKEMGWGGRLKLVVFSLLPAVVLVILLQVYADITIYRDFSVEPDPITGKPAVYHMRFGKAWKTEGSETPLNSLGLPDKEFSNALPKGDCVHVLFAGDSFTFGDAVDRHRNYFSVLERAFARAHPDRCVRFFNTAQRMTTIQEQRERIREALPLLEPDIVVLGQYQNDLTDLTNPGNAAYVPPSPTGESNWWGDVIRNRVPFSNAALVRWLTYRAMAVFITNGMHYDILDQWSVLADPSNQGLADSLTTIYRDMYEELIAELRTDGIEFGVVVMPSKLDLLAGRSPEEAFFIGLAKEVGAPYVTTFDALDQSRADYPFQMYDGHLSPAGNEVVAKEVFQWLTGAGGGVPPFPILLEGRMEGEPTPFTGGR